MNILITGRNGQLGSEIEELSKKYKNYTFFFTGTENLDITNREDVIQYVTENNINAIINCAAYTAVDAAEDNIELAKKVNYEGLLNLNIVAENFNLKLIHISTDYVFDGTNYKPYKENDTINPINAYGKTKRLSEEVILNSKSDSIIIRTSWVYSTFGNNFVKTMLRLGKERESLNVIFDQIGTPTYAKDLALACLEIIGYDRISAKNKIYHFSNEGVCSWYDFAQEIMNLANINCKVLPIESNDYPTKAKRPFYSVLNKSLIKKDFNLEIPHWKESLKNCISKI